MSRYCKLALIFVFLFIGIVLVFKRCEAVVFIRKTFLNMKAKLAEHDRKTGLEQRKQLYEFERKKSFWIMLERELDYSGMKRMIPNISGGKFIVFNLIIVCGLIAAGIVMSQILYGICAGLLWVFGLIAAIKIGKSRNMKKVSEDLPKFLDFLGSYSISAGEITGIFSQISVYLNAPLRNVLEECVAESRVSGNTGAALLAMAEKIEHPQFKQLVRNIELTARYSADFTSLVTDSRRGLREYLAQTRERKGMLREAMINMSLLLLMSVVVLMMVNMLIGGTIGDIVFHSLVGRISLIALAGILGIFFLQTLSIDK